MAFALTVIKLEEALRLPGCPVCRLGKEAASRAIDAFLWEHVTDPVSRQPIIDAYGFCGEHTRLLVALEMSSSGPVLGVNIIYEHLGRLTSLELAKVNPASIGLTGSIRALAERLGLKSSPRRLLDQRASCPACQGVAAADANHLAALFEVLDQPEKGLREIYREGDGLCLAHLRAGLYGPGGRHPGAAQWLIDETRARLDGQSARMQEYIRKYNWEYRDEKVTPEEAAAWRQMLTFFTGLPRERFIFQKDEF